MENVPHAEQAISATCFENILVTKLNGESTTMSKCNNCNIVTMNGSFNMWKHWKYTCPYKLLFKYNYPTTNPNSGIGMTVTCLVCQNKFDETTISFMTTHRKNCKEAQKVDVQRLLNIDYDQDLMITKSPSRARDTIKSAGTPPISTYRIETINMKRMRFTIKKTNTLEEKEPGQCAECQICNKLFVTDSNSLLHTCNQCMHDQSKTIGPEQDVLVSVQTTHDSSLIPQQCDETKVCFICNSVSSESFVGLYGTTAPHSGKCIFNFVWKFLGGKPSVRNDSIDTLHLKQEMVCFECFSMMEEYDKARVASKRYKKLLRNRLANTETYYARLQHEVGGNKTIKVNQTDKSQTANRMKENKVINFDENN